MREKNRDSLKSCFTVFEREENNDELSSSDQSRDVCGFQRTIIWVARSVLINCIARDCGLNDITFDMVCLMKHRNDLVNFCSHLECVLLD